MDADWQRAMAVAVAGRDDLLRVARASDSGDGYENAYREQPFGSRMPDAPYAVLLAQGGRFRTLALDLDCDDEREVQQQVKALSDLLTAAGAAWVEARSGPGARRHLLVTWQHPVAAAELAAVMTQLRQVAPSLDVTMMRNPRAGAIRPPGSPHITNGRSTVVGDEHLALATLERGNPPQVWRRFVQEVAAHVLVTPCDTSEADVQRRLAALPHEHGLPYLPVAPRALDHAWSRRLMDGDQEGRYASRSAMAFALTLSLVQSGVRPGEYLTLALNPANEGLAHLRTQRSGSRLSPRRRPRQAAMRMWGKAVRTVLLRPGRQRTDAVDLPALAAVVAAVEAGGWVGQRGPADRGVMDALLHIAVRCGTLVVSASSRQLALSTGLGDSTTARSTRRLVEAGWLALERPSEGRAAPTYRLRIPLGVDLGGALALHPRSPSEAEADGLARRPLGLQMRGHDAVTAQGLGRYAGLLLELLVDRPSSVGDLATRSGVDIARTAKHLHRLLEEGVVRLDGTTLIAPAADIIVSVLDAVADRLGTSGTAAARREEHRRDREHYDLWLADFVAAAGYAAERGLRRPGRSTAGGAPCPRAVLTRGADGRRSWGEVVALTADGLGLQSDERPFLALSGHIDTAHVADRRHLRARVERALRRRPAPTASAPQYQQELPAARSDAVVAARSGASRPGRSSSQAPGPPGFLTADTAHPDPAALECCPRPARPRLLSGARCPVRFNHGRTTNGTGAYSGAPGYWTSGT